MMSMKKQVIMSLCCWRKKKSCFQASAAAYLQIMKKEKPARRKKSIDLGEKLHGGSAERFMGSMRSWWQNSKVKAQRA